MADKRITELNELTTLVNTDELLVSDTSATETKKISVANFKTNVVGSAHTVQNNGTGLTQRANLNFDGTHVVATDDSGNNQTDVALSANLQAVSGLTSAANKGIQFTGSGTAGVYDLTTAGKALLDDANAAAQRTTLGLGALSTEASVTTSQIAAGTLVTESETIGSNDNDTTIPTSAAVKAYADSVGGSGNKFSTIAVSGQSNVVADTSTDTLTFAAGSNVTLTTNAGTDTVTIASSGGGGGGISNVVEDTTPQLGGNLDAQAFNITTTGKVVFANVYANLVDLPSASTYHGMFAHVHATGKAYFAHAGAWVRLADYSEVGGGSKHVIQNNGTGLTARTNLNFDGTHVVATDDSGNNQSDITLSANLQAVSGLTSAADKGIQFTGSGSASVYDLTAAGKALLDDASVSAQRTTLGLGPLATLAATTASRALVSDGSGIVSAATTTSAEIGYVNGVTSAIQTQINAKQPTISGSARIDAAHIHNGNVSNTEYGYLDGVTSSIQTQLNSAGTTLAGLSDTGISSSAAGQALLYDGSNSYDNKQIKVMQDNSAFTAAFPMIDSSHIYRVTGVSGSSHYTFSNYNSDGTDQNDPSLYLLCNHTYAFYLSWGGGHPFAIRTGASSGGAGTNLAANNGGDNLVHIATDGTVTTGTSANAKSTGWLIWQIPNFTTKQNASTGNYGYQCTSHAAMFGQIYIGRVQDLYGSW